MQSQNASQKILLHVCLGSQSVRGKYSPKYCSCGTAKEKPVEETTKKRAKKVDLPTRSAGPISEADVVR